MAVCDNIINLSPIQATRVKLLGVGIACGLEVFRDTQCYISITKGVGVTSNGHVICLSDRTFKYYRKYDDPKKYFHDLINCKKEKETKKCELWELIPHREENATSIVPQNTASVDKPFLEDKVVVLYLEDEAKLVVRVLLIEQSDMWEIMKCGCIFKTHCIPTEPKDEQDISIFDKDQHAALHSDEELYHAVNKKYMLKEVAVRRFGYGHIDIGDLDLEDQDETKLEPGSGYEFFSEYEVIIDSTLKKLDDEIDKLHNFFGCMIDPCHCKEKDGGSDDSPCNPVTPGSATETGLQMHNIKIFKRYFTLINKKWGAYKKYGEPVQSVQYFYDFVKDLVKTFNELLHELHELMNECCPDTDCFRYHLMLGRIREEVSFQPSVFRQPYLQPPIYNGNADRLQQIRFLHWRMVIMMKCFYIPDWEREDMSDESYFDVLKMENEKRLGEDSDWPVRITPSRLFSEALGKQAIPFYYNLSNSPYSLQHYWDYYATKHNREDHHLSYFCKEDPAYTQLTFVQHPFLYSIDQYPFYRIEGHTGMDKEEARKAIVDLKKKYRLPFTVIAVDLNDLVNWLDRGAEHVAGVKQGGTFILLYEENEENHETNIIGDFYLPYGFAITISPDAVGPAGPATPVKQPEEKAPEEKKSDEKEPEGKKPADNTKEGEEIWGSVLKRIGKAAKKDDLKKIPGIKGKTESVLNKAGITAFSQLAKLTAADIPVMAKATGLDDIKEDWFKQAKKLAKNP